MRKDIVKIANERAARHKKDKDFGKKYFNAKPKLAVNSIEEAEEVPELGGRKKSSSRTKRWLDSRLLRKILMKNVGKSWNKVYSELKAISAKDKLAYLFDDQISYTVIKDVQMIDGKPYHHRYGTSFLYKDFYVHPDSGLLCYFARPKRTKTFKPSTKILISDNQYYELQKEEWYGKTHIEPEIPTFNWYKVKVTIKETITYSDPYIWPGHKSDGTTTYGFADDIIIREYISLKGPVPSNIKEGMIKTTRIQRIHTRKSCGKRDLAIIQEYLDAEARQYNRSIAK